MNDQIQMERLAYLTTQQPDADETAKALSRHVLDLLAAIRVYEKKRAGEEERIDKLIAIVAKFVDQTGLIR